MSDALKPAPAPPAGATDGATSFGLWATLHATGLLLLVFMLVHIWSVHYSSAAPAGAFTHAEVAAKLHRPLYRFFDLGLLVLVLAHGLVGTQRIVADLGVLGRTGLRVVGAGLTVLGLAGFVYGLMIFRALLL